MRGLCLNLLIVWCMSVSSPVHAATEVTVDWPSGEVQVQKDEPEEVEQEQVSPSIACEKEKKTPAGHC